MVFILQRSTGRVAYSEFVATDLTFQFEIAMSIVGSRAAPRRGESRERSGEREVWDRGVVRGMRAPSRAPMLLLLPRPLRRAARRRNARAECCRHRRSAVRAHSRLASDSTTKRLARSLTPGLPSRSAQESSMS